MNKQRQKGKRPNVKWKLTDHEQTASEGEDTTVNSKLTVHEQIYDPIKQSNNLEGSATKSQQSSLPRFSLARLVLGPVLFVLYTTPLSDILTGHSQNHKLVVDGTQIKQSTALTKTDNLTKELKACTDDVRTWMAQNQLKLNDDKTETSLSLRYCLTTFQHFSPSFDYSRLSHCSFL